jgi:hypothetical protein
VKCPHCFSAPRPVQFGDQLVRGEALIQCERCGRANMAGHWLHPVSGADAVTANQQAGA